MTENLKTPHFFSDNFLPLISFFSISYGHLLMLSKPDVFGNPVHVPEYEDPLITALQVPDARSPLAEKDPFRVHSSLSEGSRGSDKSILISKLLLEMAQPEGLVTPMLPDRPFQPENLRVTFVIELPLGLTVKSNPPKLVSAVHSFVVGLGGFFDPVNFRLTEIVWGLFMASLQQISISPLRVPALIPWHLTETWIKSHSPVELPLLGETLIQLSVVVIRYCSSPDPEFRSWKLCEGGFACPVKAENEKDVLSS